MAQRLEHPYISATWLPRLQTGEDSCEWAVWFPELALIGADPRC